LPDDCQQPVAADGPLRGPPLNWSLGRLDDMTAFRIADMCSTIRAVTLCLWVLPVALLLGALVAHIGLLVLAVLVVIIYAWVWFGFRPTFFVVGPEALEIIWPLKRQLIPRASISEVTIVTAKELKTEVGWGVRIGAGGLWGSFGWLWTQRRGIVQMYVSRIDRFVWLERRPERSLLITPENPEAFVRAMTSGHDAGA